MFHAGWSRTLPIRWEPHGDGCHSGQNGRKQSTASFPLKEGLKQRPALLHGLAGGLGGAVNLASHGFHVFSYSADRIAGGESEGCGERQKGGFDIH